LSFCEKCGNLVQKNVLYCSNCEAPLSQPFSFQTSQHIKNAKNVWIAMTLSFFISGLGQTYAGQTQRVLGILLGAVALALILPDNFLFVILLYSLWNIYDAYKSVKI